VRDTIDQVLESGEGVVLESMNRMDRKVIHDVVAEVDGVTSRSEGEDPNRYVMVEPAS